MANQRLIEAYGMAQKAIVDIKTAIYTILEHAPEKGMKNVDIGKSLGIYMGHVGHEGHILFYRSWNAPEDASPHRRI